MNKIDQNILDIDKVICRNISIFDDSDRGLLSQNILSQLRNFIEHISLKVYADGKDIENTYDNITHANIYVSSRGNLRFLKKFYDLLEITTSHYTLDEENSERLMLKYYEYLLKVKIFLKNTYNLDVLKNIDEFPLTIDSAMKEYYEKIAEKIIQPESVRLRSTYNDRYYIEKIKPFFVNHEIYYEVTFTSANDSRSKFDRIIAFTKLNISPNYAVKLAVSNADIDVLSKKMPIQIIDRWEVSVRPCELDHFADIFGNHVKIKSETNESREIMRFLRTGLNLVEIVSFPEDYYQKFKASVVQKAKTTHILDALDRSREIINANNPGSNVLRYLLYKLNNRILKGQYNSGVCKLLSNLYLQYGCIPFDQMPFITSLLDHNPKLFDLFDCIDFTNREHELFARYITNNTEIKGQLYTPVNKITGFEKIEELMRLYNEKLFYKHENRKLENYHENLYIKGYEEDTFHIIEKLKDMSSKGIKNYSSSFDSWLRSPDNHLEIDCEEKEQALKKLFENSEAALIYGSAGTGKTTTINYVSNFFSESKLYLANTNPAVDNLKRRVNAANSTFMTIARFLSPRNDNTKFGLLIIDECSTVSNSDMLKVLRKASFTLLILVGDVFQIESIRFGNWFSIARNFIPTTSVFELTKPYRSDNPKLIKLWDKVRNIDGDILEHIAKNNYSITLNESIFEHSEEDEIILCLNYDGLYGINNINRFLQGSNESPAKQWGVHTYKVNDPILFNESNKFTPLIYNNMKGRIVGIKIFDEQIQFDIELDITINEFDAIKYDFQLMDNSENGKSIIRFIINKHRSTDEDDDSSSNTVVPFQVAYAVSIHKAQGLEYNSVKVVITDEIEEMVTHNIFYTAITRAKEKLKIYWTPETEKKVLSKLKRKESRKDAALLKSRYFKPKS